MAYELSSFEQEKKRRGKPGSFHSRLSLPGVFGMHSSVFRLSTFFMYGTGVVGYLVQILIFMTPQPGV